MACRFKSVFMRRKPIFKLIVRWHEGKLKLPAELESNKMGYFSSINTLEKFIREALSGKKNTWYLEKNVSFRVFEVTKYYLDKNSATAGEWVYDGAGELTGGYDGPDIMPFYGRSADQCRFKNGDRIMFLQGNKLIPGIIAGMPFSKAPENTRLDQSDDCYFVDTGPRWENHSHPWVHHVFPC